jgi:peptide/nickel transport system substrate-binding protein
MRGLPGLCPSRVGLAALLGALLLGVAAWTMAAEPQRGGTLKFIPHADLKVLDPIWTTAYISRNHGYMVYDVLFALDAQLHVQPQMVDTWEVSADGMHYTFSLRQGLKFHDGTPVTAEDAVVSLRRWGQKDALGKQLMRATAQLEAVDNKTLRLDLKEPFALVLDALAKPSGNVPFIMPARLARTPADEPIKEVIGSGPFTFVHEEWQSGHRVVYVRNADYVPRAEPASFGAGGKQVYVDRVEWLYIPNSATASAALAAGEVDYWEYPPVDFISQLEKNPNITVSVVDPMGTQGLLRPHHLHPPFNDKRARQALLYILDQEMYLRAAIGNPTFWRKCAAYFICGSPWESEVGAELFTKPREANVSWLYIEKAKQLLKEAGYDGRPVVLLDPTDLPHFHAATLVTRELLTKAGINVDLQPMDWSTLVSRRAEKNPPAEGGWNLFLTQFVAADVFSPAINAGVASDCDQAWFGWPCSAQTETLRAEWSRTQDSARKKALTDEIQRLAYEEVPYVLWGQWFLPSAFRTYVKGVLSFPAPIFWNVWLDKR